MKVKKVEFKSVQGRKALDTKCIITLDHTSNILLGNIIAVECNDNTYFFEICTITPEYDEAYQIGYYVGLLTRGTIEYAISKIQDCTFRIGTEEERELIREQACWC